MTTRIATDESNTYVVYFYNFGANTTGTLKNLNDRNIYTAKWFNPQTGVYTAIGTTIKSTNGSWTIPSKPDNNDWVLIVTINTTPTPTPAPTSKPFLSGDLDENGRVDIFDYNLLIQNFGNTTCGNTADIDGNCKVDIFDYNTLVQNFGSPR